ncbi:WD40 repeat domain-containing protein [Pseudomarimonas arenosa]|uniref:WD40 repeat domain-containing protein n=1 Tax=Pseudomarimonas arenosa TaxID=2774145 RepID=A0AAW3ZKV7_9GAMM|nr:hypothetical protein [Pseudomarimonas arenosa]MBD8525819.1 hypothetical protein [Pseudomarimonas arenosa]
MVIGLLLVPAVSLLALWAMSELDERTAESFWQTFIAANKEIDDRPSTVVYDPELKMLAVGRESGRLELWDPNQPGSRTAFQAHPWRTEFLAFGAKDGILLSNSRSGHPDRSDERGTRIWDARTGELLHALSDMIAPGPIAASLRPGIYLIADSDRLLIYDHAKRSLLRKALKFEGEVDALAVGAESDRIAVGTSDGLISIMRLVDQDGSPNLQISQQQPVSAEFRAQRIYALMFVDQDRLISASQAHRDKQAPQVIEWDANNLQPRRSYNITLQTVNWAGFTAGEPWLVLAGTYGKGKVELVDLNSGVAWRYRANSSHPRAALLPDLGIGLILQSGKARPIRYLAQERIWSEKQSQQTRVAED